MYGILTNSSSCPAKFAGHLCPATHPESTSARRGFESVWLFEAERKRERKKWSQEIEALQEALEIARNEKETTSLHLEKRHGKPNIIRRIGRKIMHKQTK